MKHHIHVIGGATWDALFSTPQAKLWDAPNHQKFMAFPYGGKVDATDILYTFGGGGANVAVSLAQLGFYTSLTTRVGADWRGHEVVKNLKKHLVDSRVVQLDKNMPTALAFIVTAGGARDHVAFVARGATENLQIPSELPRGATWLYITALAVGDWQSQLQILFKSTRAKGQNVFWNPGAQQLTERSKLISLLKYVTILDVNKEEAEQLIKVKKGVVEINNLLFKLKSLGSKEVIVTDGARGAYYYNGITFIHKPSLKIKPVNTTGAGDAFGAGFLAGYLQAGSVKQGLEWGMQNSCSVISQAGAQKGVLKKDQIV